MLLTFYALTNNRLHILFYKIWSTSTCFFFFYVFCFLLLILRLENQMIEWKVLRSKTDVKYNLKNVLHSRTTQLR